MKEATIQLSLSKDHTFTKHNITPLEALLLVAMHHKNFGDNPVKVEKETIKEIQLGEIEVEEEVTEGGKKVLKKAKRQRTRTFDEELDRLRSKYAPQKVDALAARVRDLPETYEAAIERGLKLVLPTGALSGDGVASSMKLI